MDTEGLVINEYIVPFGKFKLDLNEGRIHSYYIISGSLNIGEREVVADDFIKIDNESMLEIDVNEEVRMFEISTKKELSYKTYLELVKN